MKRPLIAAFAIATSLLVGTAVAIYFFGVNNPISKRDPFDASKVKNINYDELLTEPRSIDSRVVRLAARLGRSVHGFYLAKDRCPEVPTELKTAVGFYEPRKEENLRRLIEIFDADKTRVCVTVTAVGRFTYNENPNGSDAIADNTHLQFELYNIEKVDE